MESAEWPSFQQLFRSQVEAVFRYHLICAGDWRTAEALTAEIFHTALAWCPRQLAQNGALIPWLWRIVRDSQNWHSNQYIELDQFNTVEVPQNQLRLFACAAQVTREWKSLPGRVTEPVGLFYFGHLEILQVAVLTHMSSEQVRRMIAQYGSGTLGDLSSELHPAGLFTQELETELEEQYLKKNRYRVPFQRWLRKQAAMLSIPPLAWTARVVTLAIIIGVTLAAGHSFSSPPSFFENGTAPLAAVAAQQESYSIPPIQDNIIVVGESGQIGLLQLDTGDLIDPINGFRYFPCTNPPHETAGPPNHSPSGPGSCDLDAVPKPRYPAQISPDGRWLTITRPIEKDSWILPLDGSSSILKISEGEARFDWAPNGYAVAFVDPLDPGNLALYDITRKTSISFPRLQNGQWLSMAWSPDSKWLVAAYIKADENRSIYFAGINPQVAQWKPLAETILSADHRLGGVDMTFGSDGKELRLPDLGERLVFDSGNDVNLVRETVLPLAPRPVQGNDIDRWYDSPDGKISVLVEATFRMHSPCPCLSHIYSSDPVHSWLIYTGGISALTWTTDSSSLIVQEPSASGTTIKRIDVKTGISQTIAANMLLVGVRKPR